MDFLLIYDVFKFRNKKISERSDDTEESPAPPLRSTRRRGKVDDSSNEREETVENKRLSRVKGKTKSLFVMRELNIEFTDPMESLNIPFLFSF